MKKIKMDAWDLKILINALYSGREFCAAERIDALDELILRLIDVCDGIKPGRKTKIRLQPGENSLILRCLIEWRNEFIDTGQAEKADAVGELLAKFV